MLKNWIVTTSYKEQNQATLCKLIMYSLQPDISYQSRIMSDQLCEHQMREVVNYGVVNFKLESVGVKTLGARISSSPPDATEIMRTS